MPPLDRFFPLRRLVQGSLWVGLTLAGQGMLTLPAHAQKSALPAAAGTAATTPENPYLAMVPVEDESDRSREKGLRLALIEVLRRAAGKQDSAFGPILAQAPNLVQQYGFQRDPASGALSFRAAFDPAAVDDALKRQGLPVFGLKTDVIEAWITEVGGVRDAAAYARVLDHFSRIRGVRRVDVAEVRDERLRLRMTVEGGVAAAAQLALSGGTLRATADGSYELVR